MKDRNGRQQRRVPVPPVPSPTMHACQTAYQGQFAHRQRQSPCGHRSSPLEDKQRHRPPPISHREAPMRHAY